MKEINILPNAKTDFKNPKAVTLDERDSEIWINSVFGVNKEGLLPARFLSGFLSGFGLAETIHKSTKGKSTPKVRIFIPRHISAFVNGIENEVVEKQIEEGTRLLTTMISHQFPTVEVFFENDQPVTRNVLETLEQVTNLFLGETEDRELQRLRESGRRRGGEQGEHNSLIYASHHAFGWSDLHSGAIFERKPPFTVINTLPPSEKPFLNVRQTITHHVSGSQSTHLLCLGKRFDLVIMMSDRPHYLLITDPDGKILEPTLEDLSSTSCGEVLDSLAKRINEEKTPWTRENLRRAKSDFERLLSVVTKGKVQDVQNSSFTSLLERELS